MTKNIIQTINELNGGSVSEGKVLKMISDEREKHVKKDLEEVEKRMTNLIVKTVLPKIDENSQHIAKVDQFSQELNEQIIVHEKKITHDEKEVGMTAEEEEEQGIIVRYGLKFDKNNEMAKLTRNEIQTLIMKANEEIFNIHDQLKGINHYIDSLDDRYKTFNRKLANGRADT